MRWFLTKLGSVPERPVLSKADLLGSAVMQFVSTLGKPKARGGTEIEWVVPPAARTRPLSIAPGDKGKFAIWCLELYGGMQPEPLPQYLQFQIQRRIDRSKLSKEMKDQIGDPRNTQKEKLRRIIRKEWLKGL